MEGLQLGNCLQALKGIPNEEKRAYLAAVSSCPNLLHRESCIERFLRCDPRQGCKAARRLVDYWEKRRHVFGSAAFSPIALSEGWALSEACKSLLKSGWISPLPRDKCGRRVCLLNLSVERELRHFLPQDKARCIFFVLQCLSEDKAAQAAGINLIIVYDDIPHTSSIASIKTLDEILQVFPVLVGSVHVVCSSGKNDDGLASFYEIVVPTTLKMLLNSPADGDREALLEQRSRIHVGMSRAAVLAELERDGLRRENLPYILGGSWGVQHHEAWLKVRMQDEMHQAREPQKLVNISFPGEDASAGEKVTVDERERVRDAWQNKIKRIRKRCRTKALQIHVAHLREQQRKSKETSQRLEQALKEANEIVSTMASREPVTYTKQQPVMALPLARDQSLTLPQWHVPQVHAQRQSLHSYSGLSSDTLRTGMRAERERLLLATLARHPLPAVQPVAVVPVPILHPHLHRGMALHEPAVFVDPFQSLTPFNNLAPGRRLSLTKVAGATHFPIATLHPFGFDSRFFY